LNRYKKKHITKRFYYLKVMCFYTVWWFRQTDLSDAPNDNISDSLRHPLCYA